MVIIIRFVFTGLYSLTVVYFFYRLIELAGFSFPEYGWMLIAFCWLLLCFTGIYWLTPVMLAFKKVRLPILEEEVWLHPLLHELNLRVGMRNHPRLLILEKPILEAFAMGRKTIVLSRGLLVRLSEHEIKAVLAHELGHLKDRDTVTGTALAITGRPLVFLYWGLVGIMTLSRVKGRWLYSFLLVVMLILVMLFVYPQAGVVLLFLVTFRMLFPFLQATIAIIWGFLSRHSEFRQDRRAQLLGYGMALKSALLKVDALDSGSLVNGVRQLWMTHPMLYRRIRRLEWLEGLRERP